jgi:hypothetical protein
MATARVRDREGSDGGAPWRVVRDAFAAVAIGAAGHAVSCIVVGNEGSATGFGAQWQRMSEARPRAAACHWRRARWRRRRRPAVRS